MDFKFQLNWINKTEVSIFRLWIQNRDLTKKVINLFYCNFCFKVVKPYQHIKFQLFSIIGLFSLAITIFIMEISMVSSKWDTLYK